MEAEPEPAGGGGTPDVLITVNGHRVALEAKKGHYSKKGEEAKKQVAERLLDGVADSGLAVCYPDDLAEAGEIKANSMLWVSTLEGEWQKVSVGQLVITIRSLIEDAGNVDAIAVKFRKGLEHAADRLNTGQLREIAEASGGSTKDLRTSGVRAALLVASAALFHSRLDHHRNELPRPVHDDHRFGGGG